MIHAAEMPTSTPAAHLGRQPFTIAEEFTTIELIRNIEPATALLVTVQPYNLKRMETSMRWVERILTQ
jgi:hypothetical protein